MTTTAEALHEISDALPFIPLLQDTRAPGVPQGPSQGPRSKPPMNLEPQALLEDIHAVTSSWVGDVMGSTWDWADWSKQPLPSNLAALELMAPVMEAQEHPAVEEFAKEVRSLHQRVRNLLGEKEVKTFCPQCQGRMHEETVGWLDCSACGHEEPVSGLMERTRYSKKTLTAKQAQEAFGVDPNTMKQWKKRERIQPVGKEGREYVYRYWDVLQLAKPELAAEIDAMLAMEAEAARAA